LSNHRSLKLCERSKLAEEQLAGRRTDINPEIQDMHSDPQNLPSLKRRCGIGQGPEASVDLGKRDCVSRPN
jgi:hypothetical protein